jgi:hypothetical protein
MHWLEIHIFTNEVSFKTPAIHDFQHERSCACCSSLQACSVSAIHFQLKLWNTHLERALTGLEHSDVSQSDHTTPKHCRLQLLSWFQLKHVSLHGGYEKENSSLLCHKSMS